MSDCLVAIQERMTARYIGSTYHVALIDDTRSVYAFTVNASTDVLTTAIPHDYILNTQVTVITSGGGVLPAPLLANTIYFVRDVSGSNLKLSATYGGAAINITDVGVGAFSITDVALTSKVLDVANYVRKELATYDGMTVRQSVTFPALVTTSTTASTTGAVTLNNTTGTTGVTFGALLLIKGGTSAIRSTTGTPEAFSPLLATKLVAAGAVDTVSVPMVTTLPVD